MSVSDKIKKNLMTQETQKRKREILLIVSISILLAILVGVEVYVFRSGQNLPSPYIIYFIGLVNFNLVLQIFQERTARHCLVNKIIQVSFLCK